ncbi:MAG: PRC-barrel domain-containing protein [Candidatus Micrarchaeota archaeon]|nr:PRC-barrel domain-containing protein [Candidatus Micrarchaeota archaeon]MDE1859002.1 PRC-barrel domain-containing protein [Candidatus Micrarchaeota archaeon]
MKLSEIYRMDIYSDAGQYLGEVQDVIIDLERGEVSRLLMVPWKNAKSDTKSTLRNKSILYKNVKNVSDVVLVSSPLVTGSQDAKKEEVDDLSR